MGSESCGKAIFGKESFGSEMGLKPCVIEPREGIAGGVGNTHASSAVTHSVHANVVPTSRSIAILGDQVG